MGLFSRNVPAPAPRTPRARELYRERNGRDAPVIADLPAQAANVLGVPRSDIDEMEAIIAAHRLFAAVADEAASRTGRQGLSEQIDRVIETVGYDETAIWDVVFALGPGGVAIAEHLTTEYFDNGEFASILAKHLAENGGVQPYVRVPDPGLDSTDPHQIVWMTLSHLGLSYTVHGAGTANDLIDAIVKVLGDGMLTRTAPLFGRLGEQINWCVSQGPGGSVFFLFPMFEAGDDMSMLMTVVDRLEQLPAPWTTSVGKKDAFVVAPVAEIFTAGTLVPLECFDALAEPAIRPHRRAVRASLVEGGFEAIGPTLLKGVLSVGDGRTQLLWASLGDRVRIVSPIATADEIADWLQAHDFGRYQLESMPPFVTLGLWVDYTAGVEGLRAEAVTLAQYADHCERSLSGPDSDEL